MYTLDQKIWDRIFDRACLILLSVQIHPEEKAEEEKEEELFVAQAMAGSMKHGGGGCDSRRGSQKKDEWQGGKGDRDRDQRDKEKTKEKLDAHWLNKSS